MAITPNQSQQGNLNNKAALLKSSALEARLARLYAGTAFSPNLFASPIGPIHTAGKGQLIPRFICISPRSSDESIRVAVHAGYDHRDLNATEGVLHLIERLLLAPDLVDGMHLTFFPLVDVLGLHTGITDRDLAPESWHDPISAEISLLARDARQHAYHVFVNLGTSPEGTDDDLIVVRLQGGRSHEFGSYADEFLTSEEFAPFAVRFEVDPSSRAKGPLSLTEDLPFEPISIGLRLPANWSVNLYREAISHISRRLFLRYRSHQSFSQHI